MVFPEFEVVQKYGRPILRFPVSAKGKEVPVEVMVFVDKDANAGYTCFARFKGEPGWMQNYGSDYAVSELVMTLANVKRSVWI